MDCPHEGTVGFINAKRTDHAVWCLLVRTSIAEDAPGNAQTYYFNLVATNSDKLKVRR
jgi:hypothetical protein